MMTDPSIVLGVDVGANGAYAAYHLDTNEVETQKLKDLSRLDLLDDFQELEVEGPVRSFIEKVSPMPAQSGSGKKKRKVGTKSMFTFGMNFERRSRKRSSFGR